MATVRWLLGILCLVICWGFIEPNRNFLRIDDKVKSKIETKTKVKPKVLHPKRTPVYFSLPTNYTTMFNHPAKALPFGEGWEGILNIAQSQIGVREATGNNDGKQVEAYLRYTGNKKGAPWCASFVSWVFGKAGFKQPVTAWSPALFPVNRIVNKPMPASVFGIYYLNLKRIAHCGLVEKVNGNWIATIEGNTNITSSREGDGVYRKLRHKRTISLYADWITNLKKGALK